jgi:heat shock protein HslJ
VAPALPTRFGGAAPGVAPVFGPDRLAGPGGTGSVAAMTELGATGPNATSDALAGTQWEILTVDGEPVVADDVPLLVTFGHDGRVSGTTGVNQLTASYSLTSDYLTFGPLATTRRAGSPAMMEQEHRIVASLAGMCSYRLDARSLAIDGPLGWVELVNTRPPAEADPTLGQEAPPLGG